MLRQTSTAELLQLQSFDWTGDVVEKWVVVGTMYRFAVWSGWAVTGGIDVLQSQDS